MILLIDNYDSFSYNLYQLTGELTEELAEEYSNDYGIKVVRNDEITIEEILEMKPEGIILSPGPGRPENAGITVDVVKEISGIIPILGVCLGHQAILMAFGAEVSYAKKLMHGKTSVVKIEGEGVLFEGLEKELSVARYHSLAGVKETMPDSLRIVATADDGEIMAVEHVSYPVFGVQFHPESIMTPDGRTMMKNYLKFCINEKGKRWRA